MRCSMLKHSFDHMYQILMANMLKVQNKCFSMSIPEIFIWETSGKQYLSPLDNVESSLTLFGNFQVETSIFSPRVPVAGFKSNICKWYRFN